MSREQNRANFPRATEMFDEIRATCPEARVLWASENGREIGKRPALEPEYFEISAETFDALRAHTAFHGRRKK